MRACDTLMRRSSRHCFGKRRMSNITSGGRFPHRLRKENGSGSLEESRPSTLVLSPVGRARRGKVAAGSAYRKRPLTRTRPRDRNHKREVTMVRQLLLAAAFVSLMSSAASADITILVPSGSEGDGI